VLLRLFVADLKMIVRNKQSLFWAIFFPIIFATIFGLFDFDDIGEAEVAVFGQDPALTQPVREAVDRVEPLELVTEYSTVEAAREALEDDELDFALIVERGGSVTNLFNEGQSDRNSVFLPTIRQVIGALNLQAADITPIYTLDESGVAGINVQYYDFVLPGLVGMAVMTYGIIGLGSTIAQYRGQRILRRILATPLKVRTFLASIVLAHLVLALVQSTIVLLWGVFVFGGTVRGSIVWIYIFVLLGNLTFLNLGFVVGARTDTPEAASGMGNAIAMPMMFFAGTFFPTATLPWILPTITRFLPLRPMIDAIRSISIEGAAITEHWSEIGQLLGWAAVTFVLAARVFKFERA
jgi:ABC-2 type transport system permease protein